MYHETVVEGQKKKTKANSKSFIILFFLDC